MPEDPANTTTTDMAPPDAGDNTEHRADVARRWYRVLLSLAILSLAIAVALNWWRYPGTGEALQGPRVGSPLGSNIPAPDSIELEQDTIELLPTRVLSYETITHQAVPGAERLAAEAVYKTLNMNIAAQIEVTVYARVEGTGSDAASRARLDELLRAYPADQVQTQVGGTVATQSYSEDGGSYVVAWTRGQYVTFVKSTYVDFIPATEEDRKRINKNQGDPVVKAVEEFQRLGKGGLRK